MKRSEASCIWRTDTMKCFPNPSLIVLLLGGFLCTQAAVVRGEAPVPSHSSPRTPEAEKSAFLFADPDLTLELVAAEPDVVSPVAMAWDAAGRLYVAEMIGYPAAPGLGRVRRLEDRDGDGKYEFSVVFADGLDFPTSVMPYKKGVLVTASPDIVYMEDSDGDGRADIRKVEWTGFVPGVQQLRANALHWALDNWIHGANGRSDYAAKRPNDPDSAAIIGRARDFRIHPLTGKFEPITGLSQFGLCHDDWGNRFLSWNTIPVRHAVIEDRYLSDLTVPAPFAVVDLADPADSGRVFPISPPPRQFNTEQSIYYNAMCGLTIYRGDALGPEYLGNAFVCESLTNLVTRRILVPDGPTFRSTRPETELDRDFLASADSWSHPVFLTTGPDGCLYIADFYREFVEHPQFVADPKARASVDFRNGAEHGRIWRVRRKGMPLKHQQPRLDQANGATLAEALTNPASWWRDTAQRLIVERQDQSAVEPLKHVAESAKLARSRLQALWTLHGLGSLGDNTLGRGLKDSDPRVRRSALRLAEERLESSKPVRRIALSLSDDPDPAVRFELALTLKSLDTPTATETLAYMLGAGKDEWINRGVLCGSSRSPIRLVTALLAKPEWREASEVSRALLLERLGQAAGTTADARAIAELLKTVPTTITELGRVNPSTAPSSCAGTIAFLAGLTKSGKGSGTLKTLATNTTDNSSMLPFLQATRSRASESGAFIEARVQAIEVLAGTTAASTDKVLLELLGRSEASPILTAAAVALARLNDATACRAVFDRWQEYPSSVRRDILAAASDSPAAGTALLDAIEASKVAAIEVPQVVREALIRISTKGIVDRVAKLLPATVPSDRQKVIDQYQAALKLTGDVKRGGALFKANCAVCHAVKGVGPKIGPDLAAVGSRRNDILLVDILDPSRQVYADFLAYTLATKEGKVLSGLVAAESAGSVTIRREGGAEETIARSDIEELRPTGKSLMPDGLEQKLNPQQFADVLEFLRRPDADLLK